MKKKSPRHRKRGIPKKPTREPKDARPLDVAAVPVDRGDDGNVVDGDSEAHDVAPDEIIFDQHTYEATKNPVYVWEALADLLNPEPDEFYPESNAWRRHPSRDDVVIPSWIRLYLARVATAIAHLSRPHTETEIVDDTATQTRRFVHHEVMIPGVEGSDHVQSAIAKAFEFTRGRRRWNPFAHITNSAHQAGVALEVYQKRHRDGLGEDAAIRAVVNSHPAHCGHVKKCQTISVSAVRSYWKKHQSGFPPLSSRKSQVKKM